MNKKTLFIFTRDLRLYDNTGLIDALKNSEKVLPCFIINPQQVNSEINEYKSENALQFMKNSLAELNNELRKIGSELIILYGDLKQEISEIHKKEKIDAIFMNKDCTPFAKKRENELINISKNLNINFQSFNDTYLNEPELIKNKKSNPFTIFTYYYRTASQIKIKTPEPNKRNNYTKLSNRKHLNPDFLEKFYSKNKNLLVTGGRKEGLEILRNIKQYSNYDFERNIPYKNKTTHLSAHLKFGTVSIRETYHSIKNTLGETHALIRQLYWRDFFYQIAHNFPEVFGSPFNKKYSKIRWKNDKKKFEAWKKGKTGFPIIDAGMRELNTTGYMHNRVRMIVASFLVKDLHIDWKKGEQYFASKLTDYDPSINNGNWQWCASTGCDSQPYFRIFNPWLQQKKFDENAEYIKKWVPELQHLKKEEIHKIYDLTIPNYPSPIINHDDEKIKTLNAYKNI